MQANSHIKTFLGTLSAAGVMHRCNWQAKRDPRAKYADIEHLSFSGDGFAPSVSTAIIIDYGEGNGFGLYLESPTNSIEADVAAIAKPRAVGDDANDTVNAITQAEAFIRGFEDDETQEGIADLLAGLRTAIAREQAAPDMLAALKGMRRELDGDMLGYWTESMDNFVQMADAAITKAEGRYNAERIEDAAPGMLAALKWAMTKVADDGSATYAAAYETIMRAEGRTPDPRDEFIGMVSRLNAYGDDMGEEEPKWEHDTGDSLDTLDALIHKARQLTGTPHDADIANEFRE